MRNKKISRRSLLVDILYDQDTDTIILEDNITIINSLIFVKLTQLLNNFELLGISGALKEYTIGNYRVVRKLIGPYVRILVYLA